MTQDMDKTVKNLCIASLLILLIGCSVISERKDWNFIEKVGGLTVAGQDKNPNWLIIRGDVSGLREFSTKPSQVNSALAVKSVERKITNSTIQIYVVTTVVSEKFPGTEISGVDISDVNAGTYKVQ